MNNNRIVEFLDEYIASDSSEFAVLIDGKWGCGKTHFLQQIYLQRKILDSDSVIGDKALYITLAGCTSVKDLQERIFRGLTKLSFNEDSALTLSALEFVTKHSLDAISGDEGDSANYSLVAKMLGKTISKSMEKAVDLKLENIETLIFDDIERINLPMEELVGFLNQYIEHDNKKVILVADSTEIKQVKKFRKLKEKIIGQELIFQQDIKAMIEWNLKEFELPSSEELNSSFYEVVDSFKNKNKIDNINLRILRRVFIDFKSLIGDFDLEDMNLVLLFEHIFLLRYHLGLGDISIDDLLELSEDYVSLRFDADEKTREVVEKRREKSDKFHNKLGLYFDKESFLFFHYFFKHGIVQSDNKLMQKHYSFASEHDWVELWNIWSFSTDEEVLTEFDRLWSVIEGGQYNSAGDLLQVIGISIDLAKYGMVELDGVCAKSVLAIEKIKGEQIQSFSSNRSMMRDSWGGHGIKEFNEPKFIELRSALEEKIDEYIYGQFREYLELTISDLQSGDMDRFKSLSRQYCQTKHWWGDRLAETSILDKDFAVILFNSINSYSPRQFSTVFSIINDRYVSSINSDELLKSEEQFVTEFNRLILNEFPKDNLLGKMKVKLVNESMGGLLGRLEGIKE